MKIVHVADSDKGGGAAHATARLHRALVRIGIRSKLLVHDGTILSTRGDADPAFPIVRDALVQQYVMANRSARTNTHFSLAIDGVDLSRIPAIEEADTVHLHWVASMQTPADIAALLRTKPVVWTLHDLAPLTGGCHFLAGCDRYTNTCEACPQLARDPFAITATTLRDKRRLWAGSGPRFVAPSRAIQSLARQSALVRDLGAEVVHIPNGIDVDLFRPRTKAAARSALGLPTGGLYVLCGSQYNTEKRKGLEMVGRVLRAACTRAGMDPSGITLLTVGEPRFNEDEHRGLRIHQLGHVAIDAMPGVYAAADVFLHPSVDDNFPCMVMEAASCGTPTVAFDVGGIAEIVPDGVGGRLAPVSAEAALSQALADVLGDDALRRRMGENARSHVVERFNDLDWARRHVELYAAQRPRAPFAVSTDESGIDRLFPRWSTVCLVADLTDARRRLDGLELELERREALLGRIHAEAADMRSAHATAHATLSERDDDMAKLRSSLVLQHDELELMHRVADERGRLIERLHRAAQEQTLQLELLHRTAQEQTLQLELVHRTLDERARLIERLHHAAQEQRLLIEKLSAPLVTIGVPVRNGAAFLRDALDSALAQNYPNLEILISDNASSDETEAIGRAYADRDSRVRYWRNPVDLGLAGNFGKVLSEARGTYFSWLAHDDLLSHSEYVRRTVTYLEEHPDVGICTTAFEMCDVAGPDRITVRSFPEIAPDRDATAARSVFFSWPQERARFAIYGMVRRAALAASPFKGHVYRGRFAVSSMEYPILLAVLRQWRIVALPDVLRTYRRNPAGRLSGFDFMLLGWHTKAMLLREALRFRSADRGRRRLVARALRNFLPQTVRTTSGDARRLRDAHE